MVKKLFFISAGGTGGHIMPAIAVADSLLDSGQTICWFGNKHHLEYQLVKSKAIKFIHIPVVALRGKNVFYKLKALSCLMLSCVICLYWVLRLKPKKVLCTGGYTSAPLGMAAALLKLPLMLQEQNTVAGMSNKMLATYAQSICTGFPSCDFGKNQQKINSKIIFTGNPLRNDLYANSSFNQNITEQSRFKLLVLGGSQGAAILNQVVPQALEVLANTGVKLEVMHQAGAKHLENTKANYQILQSYSNIKFTIINFIDDIAKLYDWADLAIARAGALTLAELIAKQVPSILVPYMHATDDHQTKNANYLVDINGAFLVKQTELTKDRLAQNLEKIIKDKQLQQTMQSNLSKLNTPFANQTIANILIDK